MSQIDKHSKSGNGKPQAGQGRIALLEMPTTTGPNGEDCKTCRFNHEMQAPPPNLGKVSLCKKDPPQIMLMPTAHGMVPGSAFPQITDWCFGFEPRPLARAPDTDPPL